QDPETAVQATVADLVSEGLGAEWKGRERVEIRPQPLRDRPNRSLWTVAEVIEDEIRPVTFELLGRSIQLAQKLGGEVAAVLIGGGVKRHVTILAQHGADKIYLADSSELVNYDTEKYASVLARAIQDYAPYAVLVPATANGRDFAPRVAARLGLGLTGDCIGLRVDEEGRLVQLKPAFGGNIIAPILTRTLPAMATIRPGMLQPPILEAGRKAAVISLPVENLVSRLRFISSDVNTEEGVSLDEAEVIIGVGMGIGGPENLPLVHDLARVLRAHIGGTRRVIDAGWLPRQQQIGLTGHSVSPALYIALGISGGFNHTVGIQRAGLILAINKNPEADIFKHCDYGLVGDWETIVRTLIGALQPVMTH
ncbi:MAG: electron transfer flavoprotein subunit alpha/FixB family protein, partial [Rudaea sp.]